MSEKYFMLTNDQYNALAKATKQTKTDCWFWIIPHYKRNGSLEFGVVDLENGNKIMSWADALSQLGEALDAHEDLRLSESEIKGLRDLYSTYNVPCPV